VHLVVLPVSYIGPSIRPFVGSPAFDIVVLEVSFVVAAVCEVKLASAVLDSINEYSIEGGTVGPVFLTSSVLLVVFPVAFVPV
jgi:hypothetical protein